MSGRQLFRCRIASAEFLEVVVQRLYVVDRGRFDVALGDLGQRGKRHAGAFGDDPLRRQSRIQAGHYVVVHGELCVHGFAIIGPIYGECQ